MVPPGGQGSHVHQFSGTRAQQRAPGARFEQPHQHHPICSRCCLHLDCSRPAHLARARHSHGILLSHRLLQLDLRLHLQLPAHLGTTSAMSKQPNRANGASTKRLAEDGGASPLSNSLHKLSLQHASGPDPPADSSADICPVCKSSRYLNPNMKFKVNPECYHKMCESCVDRIFSHGPAPCPIAGCARTLRKAKFRTQTFEDLKVEREVDIRRRVARAQVSSHVVSLAPRLTGS